MEVVGQLVESEKEVGLSKQKRKNSTDWLDGYGFKKGVKRGNRLVSLSERVLYVTG